MGAKRKRGRMLHRRHVVGREWDRATELLALFSMTGWGRLRVGRGDADAKPRPQSLVLVGPPGKGKTQLLERFRGNRHLAYRSDLTVRQLWSILSLAQKGRVTHVAMPEFQKIFQRKASTAENCVGTLTEAMDEGVTEVSVGPQHHSFDGARLGLLAGMTGRSLRRRQGMLYEMGFLDRCAMLPWNPPDAQIEDVLNRIARGDSSDIQRVVLPVPPQPIVVEQPPKLGQELKSYVWQHWPDTALRIFQRFRYLVMAAALLDGRDVCRSADVDRAVHQFRDYWDRLLLSDVVLGMEEAG